MENFIVAILLLVFIAIFAGVNSFIICDICDEMISLVENDKTEEAKKLWEDKRDYIAIFVRDAEVDVVDAEMDQASSSTANEDGEAESKKMSLVDSIKELMHGEKPNFEDIFIVDIKA